MDVAGLTGLSLYGRRINPHAGLPDEAALIRADDQETFVNLGLQNSQAGNPRACYLFTSISL